ncbi:MAG: hypothetical protein HYW51_02070 [Candidatus Doudnabacteria bacterium]|nr:hypothetical protein [Candidatus Doudnabacteria bacterium]
MKFTAESPAEYFRGLVESAIEQQRIPASQSARYYLTNLLCGYVSPSTAGTLLPFEDELLVIRLCRALSAGGRVQRTELRLLGDVSLFAAGYFSDSFRRKLVDVDYYITLGGCAYTALSQAGRRATNGLFAELADKFVSFADVLADVSEQSGLTSNRDLLRLYERWLKTRSLRDARKLAQRGITPNLTLRSLRVQ